MTRVEFYRHTLGEEEAALIASTLEGVFLTAGPQTRSFEQRLAAYLGVADGVGLTSCTAAIFLALKAMDIGPGDEVITTPMTFIASSNSILHVGATPVFVDCEAHTGNIEIDALEAAITPRTKAVLPVHLYGQLVDMRRLSEVAKRHNVRIIEDSAHCVEGERDGVQPGQLGDVACFSFYATKNLTSGEGGAVAGNDLDLLERIRLLRSHGMNKEAASRYTAEYKHWDMLELGYKFNMFDIQAAMLLPQLDRLDNQWKRREEISRRYEEAFAAKGIEFPVVVEGSKSARHIFTIWVDPNIRDSFLDGLQKREIGVAVNFRAVHTLTYYREKLGYERGMYPNAERIGDSTITIPMYPKMTDEQVETVIEAVLAVHGELTATH